MDTSKAESTADEARAALLSDIRDLKQAERGVVSTARAKLPWVIGGGVGLLALGIVVSKGSGRRSSSAPQRSLLGRAARAAALAAIGIVTRRLFTRALNRVLPEPEPVESALRARVTSA